jgi:4-hydroxy-3-polyprenylbenzoate decarboxylase
MPYASLYDCIPNLEMAAIHRRVFAAGGPAVYYENVKGSEFPAVSNLFGTIERSRFLFRENLDRVKQLITLKSDPFSLLKNPLGIVGASMNARLALPKKVGRAPSLFTETILEKLPAIKSWPNDGGPYILLPQVYTEDPDKPGVMRSNLGCYRVQMSGNEFETNREMGLHYQIHRGIGVHQAKANKRGEALKVCIFVGGPPSHTFSAVMPLPEGVSELIFAGVLGGRRFRYKKADGYTISADADFVITGEIHPHETKPEGPFGDHLGYYSLTHEFPLMRVHKVYHRKNAIWPFTVVGRPPQEDTSFGAMIHEIVGPIVPSEIPGLHQVHAVDEAGVHPLLLAMGSERYTPYLKERRPQEILTTANAILGFGQMSLAKYLWIAAKEDDEGLDLHDVQAFFAHMLERVHWDRDLHFHTKTTIDTLDYSGTGLNSGSKLVVAVAGEKCRTLGTRVSSSLTLPPGFSEPSLVMPGLMAIGGPSYEGPGEAANQMKILENHLAGQSVDDFPLLVLCDDSTFVASSLSNFLWITFTRSNPSHDIYGVNSFVEHKHWGCKGPLIIDARIKKHHAPPLQEDPVIEKRVDALGAKSNPSRPFH